MPSDNYGSATLLTSGGPAHLPTYFAQTSPRLQPGFFLGLNLTGPYPDYGVCWYPDEYRGMAVSFGSARSGKGASTIIPALMGYAGNVLCLDIKAELAWITAQRRRDLGHKVVIVDPFGELDRSFARKAGTTETITKYNPLSILDSAAVTFPDDVAGLCEGLVVDNVGGGENSNYFNLSARELAIGLVAAEVQDAHELGNPALASLRNVREMVNMEDSAFAQGMKLICDRYPGSLAAKKLAQFQPDKDGRLGEGARGIKNTLKQQTAFLDSEELLRGMELQPGEPSFNFSELCTGKISIYLVLPATYIETHSRWFRMMISQAVRTVLRLRGNVNLPILMLCDEAGTALGRLPIIETAYGLTSGMGLLVWSFYQDISQIQRDYPRSWQTFIGNSAMVQVVGARDQATAEYFSKVLGTTTVKATSTSAGQNFSSGGGGFNEGSSTGEISRPLMFPKEIMDMPGDQMLIIFPGHEQYKVRKLAYFSDGRLSGMYRPDPHYGPPPPRIATRALTQADLDAKLALANKLDSQAAQKARAPYVNPDNKVETFLAPARPYTSGRKAAVIAALCFWGLFLFSMFQQGRGYGRVWQAYAFFFLAIFLLLIALRDAKHRAAVIGVSALMLFWSSNISGGLMRMASMGGYSYAARGVTFSVGGVPLYEFIWPLFLFDGKFRQLLVLTWRNGYTRQGKVLVIVMTFDNFLQRLRVTAEGIIFIAAAIALTWNALTGGIFLHARAYHTPLDYGIMIVLLIATAGALFMAIPMYHTLGRPSVRTIKGA